MTPEYVRLVDANESKSYDWTRAGASIALVPLLWNSHSCDCLRCSDHVGLCRIECDNGTMPYAHRGVSPLARSLARPPFLRSLCAASARPAALAASVAAV